MLRLQTDSWESRWLIRNFEMWCAARTGGTMYCRWTGHHSWPEAAKQKLHRQRDRNTTDYCAGNWVQEPQESQERSCSLHKNNYRWLTEWWMTRITLISEHFSILYPYVSFLLKCHGPRNRSIGNRPIGLVIIPFTTCVSSREQSFVRWWPIVVSYPVKTCLKKTIYVHYLPQSSRIQTDCISPKTNTSFFSQCQ